MKEQNAETQIDRGVKTCYLIDVENVGNTWIEDITQKKNVKVCLFFTAHCPSISYVNLAAIMGACSEVECFQCDAGANAVDFQMVSYLGFLLGSGTECGRFVIVSNDKGFDCVCNFWNKKGCRVERHGLKSQGGSTSSAQQKSQNQTTQAAEDEKKAIRKNCLNIIKNSLPQDERSYTGEILTLLEKNKDASLQMIYQTFIKTYGQKKGLLRYQRVKPVIGQVYQMMK